MRVVIQVSGKASCTVDYKPYSEIEKGLFVLVGFTEGDNINRNLLNYIQICFQKNFQMCINLMSKICFRTIFITF